MALTAAVAAAVDEIRRGLPATDWQVTDDDQGGAVLLGSNVSLGPPWAQADTWIGFRIPFSYPYADVYPHFVRGDLARADGGPIGEAMSTTTFEDRPAVQISRRSTRRDPSVESALIKLLKVISWLCARP